MSERVLTPRRPYMLRAMYDWMVDNQLTPHLLVDAEYPGCDVPRDFVNDGQIILNISPTAVSKLLMSGDAVQFGARFANAPMQVFIPMGAVVALYARENGVGTVFEPEAYYDELASQLPDSGNQEAEKTEKPKKKSSGSHLRVVK